MKKRRGRPEDYPGHPSILGILVQTAFLPIALPVKIG
jgi:hypothetical protein